MNEARTRTIEHLAEAGPVQEFSARLLFSALRAHANSVAHELKSFDEKDAGYRGDRHTGAIIHILDSALRE